MKKIVANFRTDLEYIIVIITNISRNKISINPSRGDFNPKKKNDHIALSKSWIPNIMKKIFLSLDFILFFQTRYKDIPIRKYSIIQVGANIQFGGAKCGFVNEEYQTGTASNENNEPKMPADWQIIIEIMNLIRLFIYSIFFILS